jgi:hypothetical protein
LNKNGNDFTQQYPMIAAAERAHRAREAIIDAELVACRNCWLANFLRLLSGKAESYELSFGPSTSCISMVATSLIARSWNARALAGSPRPRAKPGHELEGIVSKPLRRPHQLDE